MKSVFSLLFFLFIIGAALLFTLFIYIPEQARSNLETIMAQAGFTQAELPEGQTLLNGIMFENIALDPEGLSTIQALKIKYDWAGALKGSPIKRLEIIGLNLTGDLLEDPSWDLEFAGFTPLPLSNHVKNWTFETLVLKDTNITFLTQTLGGLTLSANLQLRRQDNHYAAQGLVKSSQRLLNFEGPLSGLIREDGWTLDMEIERGKIDIQPYNIKATRMHGTAALKNENATFQYTSNLQAGGLVLQGFPWQNAAATLHGNTEKARLILNAKSIGIEGIEINLDQILTPHEGIFSIQIFANDQENLTNYIQKDLIKPLFEKYGIDKNFTIHFQGRWNNNGLDNIKVISLAKSESADLNEQDLSSDDKTRLNAFIKQLLVLR